MRIRETRRHVDRAAANGPRPTRPSPSPMAPPSTTFRLPRSPLPWPAAAPHGQDWLPHASACMVSSSTTIPATSSAQGSSNWYATGSTAALATPSGSSNPTKHSSRSRQDLQPPLSGPACLRPSDCGDQTFTVTTDRPGPANGSSTRNHCAQRSAMLPEPNLPGCTPSDAHGGGLDGVPRRVSRVMRITRSRLRPA